MRLAWVMVFGLLVGTAASAQPRLAVSPVPGVSYAQGFADGVAAGRRAQRAELRASEAFDVPGLARDGFDNRNPALPSGHPISDDTWWKAFRRGNRTRQACGVRLFAAQESIDRMLRAVREPDPPQTQP